MTNEEISRKMDFIVEQQAQFAVDIERLKESQERTQRQIHDLAGALVTVVRLQGEYQEQTKNRFAELAEAQKKTDEHLQVMMDVINNYIRKRHSDDDNAAVIA